MGGGCQREEKTALVVCGVRGIRAAFHRESDDERADAVVPLVHVAVIEDV